MTIPQKTFQSGEEIMKEYIPGYEAPERVPRLSPGREAGRRLAEELKKELEKIMKNSSRKGKKRK